MGRFVRRSSDLVDAQSGRLINDSPGEKRSIRPSLRFDGDRCQANSHRRESSRKPSTRSPLPFQAGAVEDVRSTIGEASHFGEGVTVEDVTRLWGGGESARPADIAEFDSAINPL